jgi:hypothetical protein
VKAAIFFLVNIKDKTDSAAMFLTGFLVICGYVVWLIFAHLTKPKQSIDADKVWERSSSNLGDVRKLIDSYSRTNREAKFKNDDVEVESTSSKSESERPGRTVVLASDKSKRKPAVLQKIESDSVGAIVQEVVRRKVEEVVHFTRVENLQLILKKGLLSKTVMQKESIDRITNDELRLDNRLDRISLSITHPNSSMFYKYRELSRHGLWVVIVFKKDLLWELDCLFCKHNAADRRIVNLPDSALIGAEAFCSMFDIEGRSSDLKDNETTDPQAEVLCKSAVPVQYIRKVVFPVQNEYIRSGVRVQSDILAFDENYFNTREFNKKMSLI